MVRTFGAIMSGKDWSKLPGQKWRAVVKVHEAADRFPIDIEDSRPTRGADILRTQLVVPFAFWRANEGDEWELLDGRGRGHGLELNGVEPFELDGYGQPQVNELINVANVAIEWLVGGDPYELVMSLNLKRRHLTFEENSIAHSNC